MKMRYCKKCRTYTLQEECKKCGEKTVNPHPPRFSPSDPYGAYRRKMKALSLRKQERESTALASLLRQQDRETRALPNGKGVKSG